MMMCSLCQKEVEDYQSELNLLKISDGKSVTICNQCVKSFLNWQEGLFAKLYPTTLVKRMTKMR